MLNFSVFFSIILIIYTKTLQVIFFFVILHSVSNKLL